jgi:hypothetical protein
MAQLSFVERLSFFSMILYCAQGGNDSVSLTLPPAAVYKEGLRFGYVGCLFINESKRLGWGMPESESADGRQKGKLMTVGMSAGMSTSRLPLAGTRRTLPPMFGDKQSEDLSKPMGPVEGPPPPAVQKKPVRKYRWLGFTWLLAGMAGLISGSMDRRTAFSEDTPTVFVSSPESLAQEKIQADPYDKENPDAMEPAPIVLPFHITMPGTRRLSSEDVIRVMNANGGPVNRLGLYRPQGISKQDLEQAKIRTTDPDVQKSLQRLLEAFDTLNRVPSPPGQVERLNRQDVDAYVDRHYGIVHRLIGTKEECKNQVHSYMAERFGMQEP